MRWRNRVSRYVAFVVAAVAVWSTTGCNAVAGDGQAFVQDLFRKFFAAYLF